MISRALHSSVRHDWHTPGWLIDVVHDVYGRIDLDPMTDGQNVARAKRTITPAHHNNTPADWNASEKERVLWLNPPYGRGIGEHVQSWIDAEGWRTKLLLVPARTETRWFRNAYDGSTRVMLLAGRLRFDDAGPAPFPSALFVHDHSDSDNPLLEAIAAHKASAGVPIEFRGLCVCEGAW